MPSATPAVVPRRETSEPSVSESASESPVMPPTRPRAGLAAHHADHDRRADADEGERAAAKIEMQDPREGVRALGQIGWWRRDVAHERRNGRRLAALPLPGNARALISLPGLLLGVPMMRRWRGGWLTVKRVEAPRLGNTVVMTHDLRIVDPRGSQKWHGHDH